MPSWGRDDLDYMYEMQKNMQHEQFEKERQRMYEQMHARMGMHHYEVGIDLAAPQKEKAKAKEKTNNKTLLLLAA